MEKFKFCFKSAATSACDQFSTFIDGFANSVSQIKLNECQTNEVFKKSKELANQCISLSNALGQVEGNTEQNTLRFVNENMDKYCTSYKRQQFAEANPLYVSPNEYAVGTRWEMVLDKMSGKRYRQSVQSTFQYVSIIDTLKSIFADPNFTKLYMEYNNDHQCQPGVYEKFCCSEVWKTFGLSKNALLIEIFTDDFEICSVLKSKANLYKTCAVYFQVKNLPSKYLSKLSSIYLVALCNPDDLKQEYTNFNNILDLILKEVKILESDGIVLKENIKLKGTICNMAFDNLGGNTCLGFAESFNANYFCRICETPKEICQTLTYEIPSYLRTEESYNQILSNIQNKKFDLTMSKGIKLFCSLNNLKYFHITRNISVNLDHDLNEGIIPFTLRKLFVHCITMSLMSLNELENRICSHNYGYLNRKNIPSILCIDKKNLNQNASQLYCLATNIPFILSHLKCELREVWPVVSTLLQVMQIIYSRVITEDEVKRLQTLIQKHLELVMSTFGCLLIPKHHILTHYPRAIRSTGPPLNMWSMRYEGKHRFFTDLAQKTNNFINIYKTMAIRHQTFLLKMESPYTDHVETQKIRKPFEGNCEKYRPNLIQLGVANDKESHLFKSLKVNGVDYKEGLLIQIKKKFYEIEFILYNTEKFYLLTSRIYSIKKYEEFYNSLLLESTNDLNVIQLSGLNDNIFENQTYEKIFLNGKFYVKCLNLNITV